VIIQILERASFASGSADVRQEFLPILVKISQLIAGQKGTITVSGHTDNVPISNSRFRSNWELSTARAVSVAEQLLRGAPLDESRLVVAGHADTRPQANNDTAEGRARNRRVDISISRGIDDDKIESASVSNSVATADIRNQNNGQ